MSAPRTAIGQCREPHGTCRDCGDTLSALYGPHACLNADRWRGFGSGDFVQVDGVQARVWGPFERGPGGVTVLVGFGWHGRHVPADTVKPAACPTNTETSGDAA